MEPIASCGADLSDAAPIFDTLGGELDRWLPDPRLMVEVRFAVPFAFQKEQVFLAIVGETVGLPPILSGMHPDVPSGAEIAKYPVVLPLRLSHLGKISSVDDQSVRG